MQPVVTDQLYEFVPPYEGNFWPNVVKHFVPGYLRRRYGVTNVEFRHVEQLHKQIERGGGVMLAPNHSSMADPLVLAMLAKHVGNNFFIMASSHLFYQSRFMSWVIRHAGAFSVYREGVDRDAVNAAIDILTHAKRPLVIFPEGCLSHTNDRLGALMAGVPLMARAAAKRRAMDGSAAADDIVVLPVAVKYLFKGTLTNAIEPLLDEIEARLSWRPRCDQPLIERIYHLGHSLLTLKELEFFGDTQSGTIEERLHRLIDHLLVPAEKRYLDEQQTGTVIARVKELRKAVLPEMIDGQLDADEWDLRTRELEDMYLAQQLSQYPSNYVGRLPTVDRLVETVGKFELHLTGEERPRPPTTAVVQIGEPIPVESKRPRDVDVDPVLVALEDQLQAMLDELAHESAVYVTK